MIFSKNIKLLRKRRKRTQDDVSKALEMKRSTLSGYENEVAKPSIEVLIAFSDYFNISIDTLVKVDLSELSENQLSELERGFDVFIKGSQLRVLTSTVNNEDNENIELVTEKAQAGYTRGFADPDYISALPVFNLPFLQRERKYRTFQVAGDSMLPIPEGAWITGEFVQDWYTVKNNEAYIILTLNEGVVFKIVENKIRPYRKLTLYSLNPIYAPYDIDILDIKEIWKFVHFISSEIPDPKDSKNDLISVIKNLKADVDSIKQIVSEKPK